MNNKNLKPFKSVEEARENGRKGGIKSGEAKRMRKTLKEELLALLSLGQEQEKMCTAMLKQAQKGNVKAFAAIRDTVGEAPAQKQEITGANGEPIGIQKVFITQEEKAKTDKHIDEIIGGDNA